MIPNRVESKSPFSSLNLIKSTKENPFRRHRRRRQSDNESELSRGSGRSHNSHRKHRHQRSKNRSGGGGGRGESGSDNEGSNKARSFSGHRKSAGSMELIDSNVQWHDVQRRQAELGSSAVQQASVLKSSQATSKHHHQSVTPDTDSQSRGSSHNRSRRHKKNR